MNQSLAESGEGVHAGDVGLPRGQLQEKQLGRGPVNRGRQADAVPSRPYRPVDGEAGAAQAKTVEHAEREASGSQEAPGVQEGRLRALNVPRGGQSSRSTSHKGEKKSSPSQRHPRSNKVEEVEPSSQVVDVDELRHLDEVDASFRESVEDGCSRCQSSRALKKGANHAKKDPKLFDHVVRYRAAYRREQRRQNQHNGDESKQLTANESKALIRSLRAAGYNKPLTHSDLQEQLDKFD